MSSLVDLSRPWSLSWSIRRAVNTLVMEPMRNTLSPVGEPRLGSGEVMGKHIEDSILNAMLY